MITGLCAIFLVALLVVPSASAFIDAVWDENSSPASFDAVQGQYTYWCLTYIGSETTPARVSISINWTYIPPGFQVSWNDSDPYHTDNVMEVDGNSIDQTWGWVYVTAGANWDVPQTLEFDVWFFDLDKPLPHYRTAVKHDSITVTPRLSKEWDITGGPQSASLAKNENQTYTITITNYLNTTVTWDITTTSIQTGFSVTPSLGSISVPPSGTTTWSTQVKATGEGLTNNGFYVAASWNCHNTYRNVDISGGYLGVTYTSPSENFNDYQVWTDPADSLTVPIDAEGTVDVYVKNLSANSRNYTITKAEAGGWLVGYPNNKWVTIDPNQTAKVGTITSIRPLSPYSTGILCIYISDSTGLEKTLAHLQLNLGTATFTIQITPVYVEIVKGQTIAVKMILKNNENADRTYSIESWVPDYIQVVPSPTSVSVTAYANTIVMFDLSATRDAPDDTEVWATTCVKCDQTGRFQYPTIDCFIKAPLGGEYPVTGAFSGMIALFLPFTSGDATMAGYMVGIFFFILPLTILALAVVAAASRKGMTGHGGLVILSFYLLGLLISTIGGLFPAWFLVFHIAIIALIFARGWFTGGKESG